MPVNAVNFNSSFETSLRARPLLLGFFFNLRHKLIVILGIFRLDDSIKVMETVADVQTWLEGNGFSDFKETFLG